jgi:hypothetical protein
MATDTHVHCNLRRKTNVTAELAIVTMQPVALRRRERQMSKTKESMSLMNTLAQH